MLTNKVQQAIKESLPQQVAEEMQQFIKDSLDKDAEISLLKNNIDKLAKSNVDREQEIIELQNLKLKSIELNKKEKELLKKELTLDNILLKQDIANLEKRNKDVMRLVEKVFGHPEVTISRTRDRNFPIESSPGYNTVQYTVEVDSETTKTSKN